MLFLLIMLFFSPLTFGSQVGREKISLKELIGRTDWIYAAKLQAKQPYEDIHIPTKSKGGKENPDYVFRVYNFVPSESIFAPPSTKLPPIIRVVHHHTLEGYDTHLNYYLHGKSKSPIYPVLKEGTHLSYKLEGHEVIVFIRPMPLEMSRARKIFYQKAGKGLFELNSGKAVVEIGQRQEVLKLLTERVKER